MTIKTVQTGHTAAEAAMADLMASTYVHAGRYPEDTLGEDRALPKGSDCPAFCTTDHALVFSEGSSWLQSAAHRRQVFESPLSTIRHPIDGRVQRVGAGEVAVNLRQDPHPEYDGASRNGAPLVELHARAGGESTGNHRVCGVELTAGEARSLARALAVAADYADGLR